MRSLLTKPYQYSNEEGLLLQVLGASTSIKASSEQTGGVFNLVEISCPPHFATPLHIHYSEDVAVYVLEGALAVYWGSEEMEATAGSFFYQPRGTPHGFRVKFGSTVRILYITVPAGFDQYMMEQEHLDPKSNHVENAAQYKIEILGPLPE